MNTTTGPFPLKGVQMPTWLLRFDEHGACTSPVTRTQLLAQVKATLPTDVIMFSHGWNNDFADAAGMYAELLQRFEERCGAQPVARAFQPLFIGVVWPSIWMSFGQGPDIASGGAAGQLPAVLVQLAQSVAGSAGPAGLEHMYALLAAPGIDDDDAAELARLIAPAFGLMGDEGAAGKGRHTVADDVLAMMRAMDAAAAGAAPTLNDDLDNWVPADRRPSPDGEAPSGVKLAGSVGSLLDPRNALRLFSLYQMKDRAGTVGWHGVSALMRDLLALDGPRVHAIGHSFGCKVMLSAICAQPLPRPLASLLLLQPAVSHLCFADTVPGSKLPGGYRAALSPERVARPIFSTYSASDMPLHGAFHLAVRRDADLGEARVAGSEASTTAGAPPNDYAALGGYGPRRAAQMLVDPLPASDAVWSPPAGDPAIVAFDGSRGAINGHGDITGPQAAALLHRLVFR